MNAAISTGGGGNRQARPRDEERSSVSPDPEEGPLGERQLTGHPEYDVKPESEHRANRGQDKDVPDVFVAGAADGEDDNRERKSNQERPASAVVAHHRALPCDRNVLCRVNRPSGRKSNATIMKTENDGGLKTARQEGSGKALRETDHGTGKDDPPDISKSPQDEDSESAQGRIDTHILGSQNEKRSEKDASEAGQEPAQGEGDGSQTPRVCADQLAG